MYKLLVYYPDTKGVHTTVDVARGADVLTLIPNVLAEHDGCEHIVVTLNGMRLFAVDCAGNRLP